MRIKQFVHKVGGRQKEWTGTEEHSPFWLSSHCSNVCHLHCAKLSPKKRSLLLQSLHSSDAEIVKETTSPQPSQTANRGYTARNPSHGVSWASISLAASEPLSALWVLFFLWVQPLDQTTLGERSTKLNWNQQIPLSKKICYVKLRQLWLDVIICILSAFY